MWGRGRKSYSTSPLATSSISELNRTQAKVTGFDLPTLQRAHIALVGAGGIGSAVAMMLVRKGIGHLTLIDDDCVELSNLTRQWFDRRDVGRFKAHALARTLARQGHFSTRIDAVPFRFQELDPRRDLDDVSLVICGVDNNPTRRAVCLYALDHNLPAIHAAVSRGGNEGYTLVQQPRQACWACAFPHLVNDATYPCNLPGIIDVLMVIAGQIVFAVDTVIGDRPCTWNVREIFLDGSLPDRARQVLRRSDCALCGYQSEVSA